MTPFLLNFICEPITKNNLLLKNELYDSDGNIASGVLYTISGNEYPIINGIPRFVQGEIQTSTVSSFGDEWNYFNFTDFKINWLNHTVKNTFGSTDVFKDKIIIDAGGGSGAQTKWFVEYGAKHVILLDLSHSVDDVVRRNLSGFKNVDVIQCSIDAPPIKDSSINGIVYCHNVIQHTPSVEKTAHQLYKLVSENGEFVFNCYPLNDNGLLRYIRFHYIYLPTRFVVSKLPFFLIIFYSRLMAVLRLIPFLGKFFELIGICVQGEVPKIQNESKFKYLKRRFKAISLNTFDAFGSHKYQHHKSETEIRSLLRDLQPDNTKIKNVIQYFERPTPIGCALRVFK